jgi:hypothetical protein
MGEVPNLMNDSAAPRLAVAFRCSSELTDAEWAIIARESEALNQARQPRSSSHNRNRSSNRLFLVHTLGLLRRPSLN